MPASEWSDRAHVRHYLRRTGGEERLAEGDRALLEIPAPGTRRVLDLGTGDGRCFADADCHWKWRELALLAGIRPR